MKGPFTSWYRVTADGGYEKVDAEQITRELREADAAAGPKEGSRDWRRCPKCRKGLRAYDRTPAPRDHEFWECPHCWSLVSFPRQVPDVGELSAWEWSRVRHLGCGAFGHRACIPDVWLNAIRLEGDRLVSVLGELELARVRR